MKTKVITFSVLGLIIVIFACYMMSSDYRIIPLSSMAVEHTILVSMCWIGAIIELVCIHTILIHHEKRMNVILRKEMDEKSNLERIKLSNAKEVIKMYKDEFNMLSEKASNYNFKVKNLEKENQSVYYQIEVLEEEIMVLNRKYSSKHANFKKIQKLYNDLKNKKEE